MNRQQLIEDNMNLVYFIISREYPTYIKDEDVVQSGMLGLCKAAERFDGEKGTFSTLAGKCIRNEICMEFRRRKKDKGNLSLDYEVTDAEEGSVLFGDLIVGENDINYVDIQPFYNQLNNREKEVFNLLYEGLEQDEISSRLGMSQTTVNTYIRRLRMLWGNFYGTES